MPKFYKIKTLRILKLLKKLTMLLLLLPLELRLKNSQNGLQKVLKFLPMLGIMMITNKPGNSLGSKIIARHS
jgi:hypothetical protein